MGCGRVYVRWGVGCRCGGVVGAAGGVSGAGWLAGGTRATREGNVFL